MLGSTDLVTVGLQKRCAWPLVLGAVPFASLSFSVVYLSEAGDGCVWQLSDDFADCWRLSSAQHWKKTDISLAWSVCQRQVGMS